MGLKLTIKQLANSKGMSLTDLEKELNFGNGTITKWDKISPKLANVEKVSKFFDVSLDYLTDNLEAKTPNSVILSPVQESLLQSVKHLNDTQLESLIIFINSLKK